MARENPICAFTFCPFTPFVVYYVSIAIIVTLPPIKRDMCFLLGLCHLDNKMMYILCPPPSPRSIIFPPPPTDAARWFLLPAGVPLLLTSLAYVRNTISSLVCNTIITLVRFTKNGFNSLPPPPPRHLP